MGSSPLPQTREKLIHAAMELFALKGYASTSVAEILQTAGAGSGSLYHFFPGKQDLLEAVLDTYRAGIGPMLLEPAWKGIEDPIERVFALLGRYRALLESSDCVYGCPIGNLALELHEPDPSVRARLAGNFSAWMEAVESCLQSASDRLPAGTDVRRLASFVLVTMEGGVMLSRTYRDLTHFDNAVAELKNHMESLLAKHRQESETSEPETEDSQ
jgi:AcrR family transcriptional regulator